MVEERLSASTLYELYNAPELYSSPNIFSPPSERLDHVIRFELTRGCGWGRCTFCGGYDGVRHYVKSSEEYMRHVDLVWEFIGKRSTLASSFRRIFIGGGNALMLDGKKLHKLLAYTIRMFEKNTGFVSRRLSVYGRTADILKHGKKGLYKLRHGRTQDFRYLPGVLDLIYWGVESGSDEVLAYVNKGCTKDEMVAAGELLQCSSLDASVMIMPGLGGMKFYDQHVEHTAALLGEIQPKFVTFMGINAGPHSVYARRMQREVESGENRPLDLREIAVQMTDIIERIIPFRTKIGCFNSLIDSVGCNPVSFGSSQIYDSFDIDRVVNYLRERIKRNFGC